jgi:TPR repeat protein
MSGRAAELAATLAHDVGKYVARAARNLPAEGEIPAVLAEMLVRDLWETHAGRPARARFDELAPELFALTGDPRLTAARALLESTSAHEQAARAGDATALRALAALALSVESTLRALARELRQGARP